MEEAKVWGKWREVLGRIAGENPWHSCTTDARIAAKAANVIVTIVCRVIIALQLY